MHSQIDAPFDIVPARSRGLEGGLDFSVMDEEGFLVEIEEAQAEGGSGDGGHEEAEHPHSEIRILGTGGGRADLEELE